MFLSKMRDYRLKNHVVGSAEYHLFGHNIIDKSIFEQEQYYLKYLSRRLLPLTKKVFVWQSHPPGCCPRTWTGPAGSCPLCP